MEPTTFAELGLSPKVMAAITDAGYTIPTPIQQQAIPVAMTGRDVLGIAQTGTGKTAAFVMPMISRLESGRARARMPRSLILAPTRELAAQVAQSFEKYGRNHKLAVALLIGGVSMDDQVTKLDRGVDVLIATPGRLLDHYGRGRVMMMGVEILVIDEADRMLDMGFIPDIEKICKLLPTRRQTLFFSATMPAEITRLVDQFLNQPTRIEVAKPATAAKTITQRFVYCRDGEDWAKREALRDLIRAQDNIKNAIIFCNRKKDVAILLKSLQKHGFSAGALHGDMDQMSRTATLDKFRNNEIQLLAASDVAARGLDIPDVSHVFNFDVPWQADDYVHRIGRTGRAGREGFSASLVSIDDFKAVKEIEKITGEAAVWLGEAPSAEDLADGATRKRRRGKSPTESRGGDRGRPSRPGGDRERSGRDRSSQGRPNHDRPQLPEAAGKTIDPVAAVAGVAETQAINAPVDDASAGRERSRNRRRSTGPGNNPPARSSGGQERGRGGRPPRDASRSAPVDVAPGQGEQPQVGGPRDRNAAPRSAAPDRGDQPDRGERSGHGERSGRRDDRQRPQAVDQDGVRAERRPPRRDDSGPRVGFEDNIPAFLRRPVKST